MRTFLLGIAFLLTSFSVASSQDITYNWVNYPAFQIDSNTGQLDILSGGITTDGTIGPLSGSNIVSWSITITNSTNGSASFSSSGGNLGFDAGTIATPSQLVLSEGDVLQATYGYDFLSYVTYNGGDAAYGAEVFGQPAIGSQKIADWSNNPGQIPVSYPWVVAQAVPEPTTLILCTCFAVMGLVVYRRKKTTVRE